MFSPGAPWVAMGDRSRGRLLWQHCGGRVSHLCQQGCVDGYVVLSLLNQANRDKHLRVQPYTSMKQGLGKWELYAHYTNTRTPTVGGEQPKKLRSYLINPIQCSWSWQRWQRPWPAFLHCNNSFINIRQTPPLFFLSCLNVFLWR